MRLVFWLAMMAMWSVAGQTVPLAATGRCVAEFRLYTHGMLRVPVESVKLDGVAAKPDGQGRVEVGCGRHRVEVRKGGYQGWAGEIEVEQPYGLFTRFTELAPIEGGAWQPALVATQIEGYEAFAGCDAVRLTPAVEGGRSVTMKVSGRGGFTARLDGGPYLVALFGDGRICGYGLLVVNGSADEPVRLRLTPVR